MVGQAPPYQMGNVDGKIQEFVKKSTKQLWYCPHDWCDASHPTRLQYVGKELGNLLYRNRETVLGITSGGLNHEDITRCSRDSRAAGSS